MPVMGFPINNPVHMTALAFMTDEQVAARLVRNIFLRCEYSGSGDFSSLSSSVSPSSQSSCKPTFFLHMKTLGGAYSGSWYTIVDFLTSNHSCTGCAIKKNAQSGEDIFYAQTA
jgi:hypothetical protein